MISNIRQLRTYSILVIILLIGFIGGAIYFGRDALPKKLTDELSPSNSQTQASSEQTEVQPSKQIATMVVGQDMYEINVGSATTVLNMMEVAKEYFGFTFKTKETKELGAFVDEIAGKPNDSQNNQYWIYYINGQAAQVGVSSYIVKPDDRIEWKYGNASL